MCRDAISNPDVFRDLMNPANVQAMMQMQQAMQQLQGSNLLGNPQTGGMSCSLGTAAELPLKLCCHVSTLMLHCHSVSAALSFGPICICAWKAEGRKAIIQLLYPVLFVHIAGGDMNALASLFGGGAGGGGFGGMGSGVPPVADPETTYASQLTQLQVKGLLMSHDPVSLY